MGAIELKTNCNLDLRQLQLSEAEMLSDIAEVCKRNNIQYYLMSGTCLGAVRHKGFIPWDDDIDIAMFYEDYVRFISLPAEEFGDKYFVQNCKTEVIYHRAYTRIRKNNTTMMRATDLKCHTHQGIWLDVFPLVYVNAGFDYYYKKALISISNYFQIDDVLAANSKEFRKSLGKVGLTLLKLFHKIPIKTRQKWHIAILNAIGSSKKKAFFAEVWGGITQKYSSDILEGQPTIVLFEGKNYTTFPDCTRFLSEKYGDYLKLPPESERKGHGSGRMIVDLNRDYSYYHIEEGK